MTEREKKESEEKTCETKQMKTTIESEAKWILDTKRNVKCNKMRRRNRSTGKSKSYDTEKCVGHLSLSKSDNFWWVYVCVVDATQLFRYIDKNNTLKILDDSIPFISFALSLFAMRDLCVQVKKKKRFSIEKNK